MFFVIVRIIVAIMLLAALGRHPYGYYTLLRFVVCGVCAYSTYFTIELKKIGWAWTFGIIAVLFNPIIPIYLDRETWAFIDIGVAIIFIISLFLLGKAKSIKDEEN